MDERNLHGGHRERLKDRLNEFPESLSDHELLEALMFYSIPRKDTNAIAHALLNSFGDLKKTLSAKEKELTFIDGVGENTATLFGIVSEIARRIRNSESSGKTYIGFKDFKEEVVAFFKGKDLKEEFLIIMLDKNSRKIAQVSFMSDEQNEVFADTLKLNDLFLRYSPKFLVLAHNHPSGDVMPSESDRDATNKVALFATLHGAKVSDHIIVSGDKTYSFFQENELKGGFTDKDINKMISNIKE